jgi:hypothetical protein
MPTEKITIKKPKFKERERVFYHTINGLSREVILSQAFYDLTFQQWTYTFADNPYIFAKECSLERINGEIADYAESGKLRILFNVKEKRDLERRNLA